MERAMGVDPKRGGSSVGKGSFGSPLMIHCANARQAPPEDTVEPRRRSEHWLAVEREWDRPVDDPPQSGFPQAPQAAAAGSVFASQPPTAKPPISGFREKL